MTTTSLLPHKPPLKTRNPVFLRTSYYGSVGRPSNGRRKSAVELLQETKAFYVKSESVLDTKQELKNTDHLHVRSPTVEVPTHYRTPGNGGPVLPVFPIGTCPPYPHHHFEHYEHVQREFENFVHQHVPFGISEASSVSLASGNFLPNFGSNTLGSNNKRSSGSGKNNCTRRSTLPSGSLRLHSHKNLQKDMINAGSNIIGLPLPFPVGQQNSSVSPRTGSMEKHAPSTLPVINSSSATLPNHGSGKKDDNPPPLPPKSPRTTSKPARPQDFPQRLPVQGMPLPPDIQPPPPPRRVMPHENDHYQESNIQSKLRRLLHDGPGGMAMQDPSLVPITLPSPILPPTPPPDVTLESPMSDSGPIISPPPAFSTPVTPMLDRQNSSASEKSSQRHHPLSAAMSMVSVSISSISSRNSRKSIPDLSDISMRYSPRSGSSSSPMSPDDADGEEEDDDSSAKAPISKVKISNANLQKKSTIPKSVTENALCKVSNLETAIPPRLASHSSEGQSSQADTSKAIATVSPIRRPILRSKSDLSHRYIKSGSSSNLLGSGFTLVHVDLGLPPPPPPHQNSHYSPHNYYHGGKQPDAPDQCYHRSQDSPNMGKKRCSKSSVELERFFDKLGLDNSTPPPAPSNNPGDRSGSSSPVFFSSVSSVDSGPRRGGSIDSGDSPLGVKVGSRTVGGGGYNAPVASTSGSTIVIQHGEPSIVERNARVIKWLFNCRKAVDKR